MRRCGLQGSGPNPGVAKNMTKKVLLVAGVLLAAGSVAAISSPYFRNAHMRLGQLLAEFGDDDFEAGGSGRRHREMYADDDSQIGKEGFAKSRRARFSKRDLDEAAEDMPRARERTRRQTA